MEDEQAPEFTNVVDLQADVQVSATVELQPTAAPAPQQQLQLQGQQGWHSGLFDCEQDDCESFGLSACFPCLAFACIGEIVDQGTESACTHLILYLLAANLGVWWMYAGWYRTKLRALYGLPEAPMPDCITHLACHWCALAQEYRELAARGYDVGNGWDGRPTATAEAAAQCAPEAQGPMRR